MNMTGTFAEDFANARLMAQHCPELISSGPNAEERTALISAWSRDLGVELAQELSQLLSGGKLKVQIGEPDFVPGKDLFERVGPVAANTLMRCGDGDMTAILSLDFATAIAIMDSSFGGDGRLPEEVPQQLPRSAGLLVEQCATMIARAIMLSNGSAERAKAEVLVRSESVSRISPFGASDAVVVFPLSLRLNSATEWTMVLSLVSDRLDDLLPSMAGGPKQNAAKSNRKGGLLPAFEEMPLLLEGVLSEFEVSLSRLERIAPGDEIPLAIPSELPLRIGEEVFAHGTIGSVENRVALKLTRMAGASSADGSSGSGATFSAGNTASDTSGQPITPPSADAPVGAKPEAATPSPIGEMTA